MRRRVEALAAAPTVAARADGPRARLTLARAPPPRSFGTRAKQYVTRIAPALRDFGHAWSVCPVEGCRMRGWVSAACACTWLFSLASTASAATGDAFSDPPVA